MTKFEEGDRVRDTIIYETGTVVEVQENEVGSPTYVLEGHSHAMFKEGWLVEA